MTQLSQGQTPKGPRQSEGARDLVSRVGPPGVLYLHFTYYNSLDNRQVKQQIQLPDKFSRDDGTCATIKAF